MKPILALLLICLAAPAFADRSGSGSSGHGGADHDRARSAVERDEILPLSVILPGLQERFGGRVIKLELEEDDGRYVYELKLITPEGRILELEVDAATGLPIADTEKRGPGEDD